MSMRDFVNAFKELGRGVYSVCTAVRDADVGNIGLL